MQVVFLLFRVGLAMYVAGLTRAKNSTAVIARSICDLAVAGMAFFLIGAPILLGNFDHWFNPGLAPGMLQALLFTTIASGIVLGAVGERSRFMATLPISAVVAALIVPFLSRWMLNGWLSRLAYIDIAGASWIHAAGGTVALIGIKMVGPRDNKYHRDGSTSVIPGHSIPLAGFGAMLQLAALFAILASLNESSGLNAMLAASAAVLTSLLIGQLRYGKPDVLIILAGMLGGVVAISAGAASVYPVWAIVIGAVAGLVVPLAAIQLDLRFRMDDPTSSVSIHLVGGAWGTLAAGIFCGRGVGGTFKAIGVQSLGLAVAITVAGVLGLITYKLLAGKLRSTETDELEGLDLAEHDIGAYPDFQQNSIRSYHLREA